MARYYMTPTGDPTFGNAVANLADAFLPNAKRNAAIAQMRADYDGTLARNRNLGLEGDMLQGQRDAIGSLAEVFADPRISTILQAGGGNADQLAGALGRFQEQSFRQGARDRAVAGDQGGAVAELFGVASGPVRINDIDGGYQLNPYQQGGPITATGSTLADIFATNAKANASNASAAASNARAGYYTERTENPEKFRAPGAAGKASEISPSEVKALDDLVGYFIPSALPGADGTKLEPVVDQNVRNEVLTLAAQLYRQNGNAQQSVADAVAQLMDIQRGSPGQDGWFFDDAGEAPVVRRRPAPADSMGASAALPAPAAPQPAPEATKVLNGKTYVKINGQWFEQ